MYVQIPKKGEKEVKLRRCLLMLSLLVVMMCSVVTLTYAASKTYQEATVKSGTTSLSIKGKVDYHDPWWCVASVEYKATLDGSASDIVTYCPTSKVYVRVQDENATIVTKYFSATKLSASGSYNIPLAILQRWW